MCVLRGILSLGLSSAAAHGAWGSAKAPAMRKTADKLGAKQTLVQLSVAPSEEIA